MSSPLLGGQVWVPSESNWLAEPWPKYQFKALSAMLPVVSVADRGTVRGLQPMVSVDAKAISGVGNTAADEVKVSVQPVAVVTTRLIGKVPVASAMNDVFSPLRLVPSTAHSYPVIGPPWAASVMDALASRLMGLPRHAVSTVKFA